MICGIYAIINILTEIMYVGSSFEIENRWYGKYGHFDLLQKGKHGNPHLQAAFNKYGEKAFVPEILELVSRSRLLKREQYWMDLVGIDNLYNISPNAWGGRQSEETRRKISEMMKGKSIGNQYAKGNKYCLTEKQKENRRGNQNSKGNVAWNKGLTKETDERIANSVEAIKRGLEKRN